MSSSSPSLQAYRLPHTADRQTASHAHAQGQLYALTDGMLVIQTTGGRWVMPPGHIGWLPPRSEHSAEGHGALSGWSAYLEEALCRDLPAQPCVLAPSALISAIVERAVQWPIEPADPDRQHRLIAVLRDELMGATPQPLSLPMPKDRRLRAICTALLLDLASSRTLTQWAAWGGLSDRTLSRRFLAETGQHFSLWRQQARLQQALRWLAQGRQVGHIAPELGYETVSAFIAVFRQQFGTTPARYFSPYR
ncbi:AraC family transcriptional regulator [Chitinimonas naiadis]